LWADLINVATAYNQLPWMLVGDFNVARYSDEKIGGRSISIQQLQDFNDFIDSCALSDIKHIGDKWS